MILSHTTTDARHESWTLSCDVCGDILDPGALDAPMGGYGTQRAAVDAGETHGWDTEPEFAACPECLAGLRSLIVGLS